jgi:hypothetical protein
MQKHVLFLALMVAALAVQSSTLVAAACDGCW